MLKGPCSFEDDESYSRYVCWAEECLDRDEEMYARLKREALLDETEKLRLEVEKLKEEKKQLTGLAGMAIFDIGPFRWLFGG